MKSSFFYTATKDSMVNWQMLNVTTLLDTRRFKFAHMKSLASLGSN